MAGKEKKTNKPECPVRPRPTRAQRKSLIAEAIRYEAVQGSPQDNKASVSPPAVTSTTQTSVFSAFGKDAVKGDIDIFETNRGVNNLNTGKAPAADMAKQCSMIHRMMEMDKTDVDPRDLHKLLPSTMLSSESLDLRSDNKSIRNSAAMDLHKLLEDQAMQFNAERGMLDQETGARLSPHAEEQESPIHSSHMRSASNPGLGTTEVFYSESPVTGYPINTVMGILHPMTAPITHLPEQRSSAGPDVIVPNQLIYGDLGLARLNGQSGMMADWNSCSYQQQGRSQLIYPRNTSPSSPIASPTRGRMEERFTVQYRQGSKGPSENLTARGSTPSKDSDLSSSDDKDKNDENSKKFKSMEAALAWCHVQHSQKQVPVVPKDDVRRLVEFQLTSKKPIRAPWYRPQGDKKEVEQVAENKQVFVARPVASSVKKQGTGFFCPPGSALARI